MYEKETHYNSLSALVDTYYDTGNCLKQVGGNRYI